MKLNPIARTSAASVMCLLLILAISTEALAAKKPKAKRKSKPAAIANYVFNIPYASPEAALTALEQRTDVLKHDTRPQGWEVEERWKIFSERAPGKTGMIEWAFTQTNHPAHPTVIKRYFDVGSADHIYIDTAMKCGGDRPACQELSKVVDNANWRIKKDNERYFVKEGEFVWKDTPATQPSSAKN